MQLDIGSIQGDSWPVSNTFWLSTLFMLNLSGKKYRALPGKAPKLFTPITTFVVCKL